MQSTQTRFLERLKASWPITDWQDVSVIVAVSGGADSVSLLCGLAELRAASATGKLLVAHFNHRLRAAADDEAKFVQHLAQQLGVPCEVGSVSESLEQSGSDGIEAAARLARYDYLLKTAQKFGARFVATAHTADDQAETVLHHVIRGTGLAGLSGIPRTRQLSEAVTIIRPLLEFSRAEVVDFLAARQQSFCLDESNEDSSFTRNRIRHALLPQLAAQYNPNVREALLRLGQLAGDAQQIIEQHANQLLNRAVQKQSTDRVVVECTLLRNEQTHLIGAALIQLWKNQSWPLQQMGLAEWTSIANLVTQSTSATSRCLNLPGNIRAVRTDDVLEFSRAK